MTISNHLSRTFEKVVEFYVPTFSIFGGPIPHTKHTHTASMYQNQTDSTLVSKVTISYGDAEKAIYPRELPYKTACAWKSISMTS